MPKTYRHETIIDQPIAAVFAALIDIARWPEWDPDLIATAAPDGAPRVGSRFSITPRGAKPVTMIVEAITAPTLFIDRARLPFGVIRGTHRLEPVGNGTRLLHLVETTGVLGYLWDRMITRSIGAGLALQGERLARHVAGMATPV